LDCLSTQRINQRAFLNLPAILATLPTYNEAGNIAALIEDILALGPDYHVLVIDDNSPDGTWRIVGELAQSNPRVHLLHRTTERGRGTAGLAGFVWARDHQKPGGPTPYAAVVEMDADFSHHPRFIPSLVEPVLNGSADVVVGSRLVHGGGETGRSPIRKIITLAANAYIRILLRLPIRDCTSGFRVFSPAAINILPFDTMSVTGPEIVQEVLIHARRLNLRVTELPILFEERRHGTSTLNSRIMLRSLFFVLKRAFSK
jgi:dolichol-phosphate mannosyltransferase